MKQSTNTQKVVAVQTAQAELKGDNKLFFLFSPAQIEEVLSEVTMRPVPFAPPFLQGIANWRGHLLPVVDLEKRFAFSTDEPGIKDRFLVIRTGAPENAAGKQILRCVLRFSARIQAIEISETCTRVDSRYIAIEPSLVRGAYRQDTKIYIIPDLISILQNQESPTR